MLFWVTKLSARGSKFVYTSWSPLYVVGPNREFSAWEKRRKAYCLSLQIWDFKSWSTIHSDQIMISLLNSCFLSYLWGFSSYTIHISSIPNNFLKIPKLALLTSSTFVGFFFSSYTILISFWLNSSFHLVVGLVEVNCHGGRS